MIRTGVLKHATLLLGALLMSPGCGRPAQAQRAPAKPAPPGRSDAESVREPRAPAPYARANERPQPSVVLLDAADVDAQVRELTAQLARLGGRRVRPADAGYYVDVQEAQLRRELQGTRALVLRDGDLIVLRVADGTLFDDGDAIVKAGANAFLGTIATILLEFDDTFVLVDSRTLDAELSKQRAAVVADHLRERGVNADRLAAVGLTTASSSSGDAAPGGYVELRLELIVDDADE